MEQLVVQLWYFAIYFAVAFCILIFQNTVYHILNNIHFGEHYYLANKQKDKNNKKKQYFNAGTLIGILKLSLWMWAWITLPLYTYLQKPWKKQALFSMIWAQPLEGSKTDEEVTYRAVNMKSNLLEEEIKEAKIQTCHQLFDFCVKKYKTKKCLGTREVIKVHKEEKDGKTLIKQELGKYNWLNYMDINEKVANVGRGLRTLGVKPRHKIVLYAETCADWLITSLGCFQHSIIVVTIYSTLGEEGALYGISQTDATVVFVSQSTKSSLVSILPQCPNIKAVIYICDSTNEFEIQTVNLEDRTVNVLSFSDIIKRGSSEIDISLSPPGPEDTAIIMYTSGSTGDPKGVVITHKNITSTVQSLLSYLFDRKNDVYIAYLPLAHIFELSFELVAMTAGLPIGYSNTFRLMNGGPSGTMVAKGSTGDLEALKPTIMCCVPLILERIQKGIQSKIEAKHPLISEIFDLCFNYKNKWNKRGYGTPIMDRLIFNPIFKKPIGMGNLNLIISGGASLNPETQEFIRICLNTVIVQGYGLTETCASGCATNLDDFFSKGNVGAPIVGADIKLVNWEEGGYKVTENLPRGEIIIGGDHVAKEYYNLPDKTKEAFFNDKGKRWFITGDIGQALDNGYIEIIDRKKDLVKLPGGEYISLGKIESALILHPMIQNVCVVYGDSTKYFVVAIVSLNTKKSKGNSSPEIVLKFVKEQAEKQGLKKPEVPKYVHVTNDEWTPESGLVTATHKLKRKDIEKRYKEQIKQLYTK